MVIIVLLKCRVFIKVQQLAHAQQMRLKQQQALAKIMQLQGHQQAVAAASGMQVCALCSALCFEMLTFLLLFNTFSWDSSRL